MIARGTRIHSGITTRAQLERTVAAIDSRLPADPGERPCRDCGCAVAPRTMCECGRWA